MKVLIQQEINNPGGPPLLELTSKGIEHVEKTLNMTVDKNGFKVRKSQRKKVLFNSSTSKVSSKVKTYSDEGVLYEPKEPSKSLTKDYPYVPFMSDVLNNCS